MRSELFSEAETLRQFKMFIHTRILAVPTLMALAGCAGTSGFIALEPNPNSAKAGVEKALQMSVRFTELAGGILSGMADALQAKDKHGRSK